MTGPYRGRPCTGSCMAGRPELLRGIGLRCGAGDVPSRCTSGEGEDQPEYDDELEDSCAQCVRSAWPRLPAPVVGPALLTHPVRLGPVIVVPGQVSGLVRAVQRKPATALDHARLPPWTSSAPVSSYLIVKAPTARTLGAGQSGGRTVEVAGIEPASSGTETGLLRAQLAVIFSALPVTPASRERAQPRWFTTRPRGQDGGWSS